MKRRGGVLIESVVAMLLLSVLLATVAQIISLMRRQSRLMSQRATALQECHIALTSLAGDPVEKIDSKFLSTMELPQGAESLLPEGKLQVTLEPSTSVEQGMRLRAKVSWRPASSADPASVELSCWRFGLPRATPASGGAP